MASFSVNNILENSARAVFSGLQHPANQYDLFEVDVILGNTVIGTVSWTETSTQHSTNETIFGLAHSTTYDFMGVVKFSGAWHYVGTITFTTDTPPPPSRPNNWQWHNTIVSGGAVLSTVVSSGVIIANVMTAFAWRSFTDRVNDFRAYKGLSNYPFTVVSSGNNCTPAIINEGVAAINQMGFSISSVSSGFVPASVFINMRNSLNSIP